MLNQSFQRVLLPWEAVHSRVTKNCYERRSRQFLSHAGFLEAKYWGHRHPTPAFLAEEHRQTERAMRDFIGASINDPKLAREHVLGFVESLTDRMSEDDPSKRISPGQAFNLLKPVKLALELNEVSLPWKKIMRLIPKQSRSKDREYSLDEVRQILGAASLHIKVGVLFMASSGMRVGAFDYLDVGHVQPLVIDEKPVCGKVVVYAGEGDDEYETLISLEAYQAFLDYVALRKGEGEEVGPNSPALVVRGGTSRVPGWSVSRYLNDILWKVGLRKEKKRRHEVQAAHGLRKFFDNNAKDYVSEEYVEKLIGHDTGTKEHYDRHLPKKCIEQYLTAMPYLSIDPAYRVQGELSKKIEEAAHEREKESTDLRLKLLERDSQVNALAEKVRNQEATLKEVHAILKSIQEKRR